MLKHNLFYIFIHIIPLYDVIDFNFLGTRIFISLETSTTLNLNKLLKSSLFVSGGIEESSADKIDFSVDDASKLVSYWFDFIAGEDKCLVTLLFPVV